MITTSTGATNMGAPSLIPRRPPWRLAPTVSPATSSRQETPEHGLPSDQAPGAHASAHSRPTGAEPHRSGYQPGPRRFGPMTPSNRLLDPAEAELLSVACPSKRAPHHVAGWETASDGLQAGTRWWQTAA